MPPRARRASPADPLVELKKNGPRPLYAIDGEERVLIDEMIQAIIAASVPDHARDFNLDRLSGREVTPTRVLDTAQTLPAFAQRRVVVVEYADKLGFEKSEGFVQYIEAPNPSTVLVLVADKFDGRTKAYRAIKKAGFALRFAKPKPREMPQLIRRRAEVLGVAIETPAIRMLADAVGADVGAASQALEVLSLYTGGRKVTAADVTAVVSVTREESIFELVDAIGHGDRVAVLTALHTMLVVNREPPLRVLFMVGRHYRNLLKARAAMDAGANREVILAEVGVPPFLLNNLMDQARRHSLTELARGLGAVTHADQALKGGPLSSVRTMERLVLQLMS
ncbi:MAG: DNA polymerase III subunit delta [Myxococcota bacterium]